MDSNRVGSAAEDISWSEQLQGVLAKHGLIPDAKNTDTPQQAAGNR